MSAAALSLNAMSKELVLTNTNDNNTQFPQNEFRYLTVPDSVMTKEQGLAEFLADPSQVLLLKVSRPGNYATCPPAETPTVGGETPTVGSPSVGSPSVGSPTVGSPSVGSPSVGSPATLRHAAGLDTVSKGGMYYLLAPDDGDYTVKAIPLGGQDWYEPNVGGLLPEFALEKGSWSFQGVTWNRRFFFKPTNIGGRNVNLGKWGFRGTSKYNSANSIYSEITLVSGSNYENEMAGGTPKEVTSPYWQKVDIQAIANGIALNVKTAANGGIARAMDNGSFEYIVSPNGSEPSFTYDDVTGYSSNQRTYRLRRLDTTDVLTVTIPVLAQQSSGPVQTIYENGTSSGGNTGGGNTGGGNGGATPAVTRVEGRYTSGSFLMNDLFNGNYQIGSFRAYVVNLPDGVIPQIQAYYERPASANGPQTGWANAKPMVKQSDGSWLVNYQSGPIETEAGNYVKYYFQCGDIVPQTLIGAKRDLRDSTDYDWVQVFPTTGGGGDSTGGGPQLSNVATKTFMTTSSGGDCVFSDGKNHNNAQFVNLPTRTIAPAGVFVSDIPRLRDKMKGLKDLGFDSISIPLLWSETEVNQGQYDFRKWDCIFRMAREFDLQVVVKVWPLLECWQDNQQYWTTADYKYLKEDCPRDPAGNPLNQFMTPFSPRKANLERWLRAVAVYLNAFWKNGQILYVGLMMSKDLEHNLYIGDGEVRSDYHPYMVAAWNNWYQTKYGTAAPAPPREYDGNSQTYLRWVKFNGETLDNWALFWAGTLLQYGDFDCCVDVGSFTDGIERRMVWFMLAGGCLSKIKVFKHNPDLYYPVDFDTRVVASVAPRNSVEITNGGIADRATRIAKIVENICTAIDHGAEDISFAFFDQEQPGFRSELYEVVAELKRRGYWDKVIPTTPSNAPVLELKLSDAVKNRGFQFAQNAFRALGNKLAKLKFINDL